MSKIRIGIIGAGGIVAKMHLPELADRTDRAQVTLVAGRRESRLRRLCDRYDIPGFTQRFEDILADDAIDAVIVATPHPHHVAWAVRAIEAGKHVLVEKPLCGSMDEADAFVAAVDGTDRTVMALPHYEPHVYTMRRLVADGAIGRVSGLRARTSHGGPEVYYREIAQIFGEPEAEDLWFFDAQRAATGALFDMGVYAVAHVVALLGTVQRVTAMTTTFDKPTQLDDTATLICQTASGALATAETGWCDPGRTWEFSLHGTAGKLVADGFTAGPGPRLTQFTPTAYDRDDAEIRTAVVPFDKGVGSVHDQWLDCITRGAQPTLSHARAARHITEVLLAGVESAKTGRAVDIRSTVEGDDA